MGEIEVNYFLMNLLNRKFDVNVCAKACTRIGMVISLGIDMEYWDYANDQITTNYSFCGNIF